MLQCLASFTCDHRKLVHYFRSLFPDDCDMVAGYEKDVQVVRQNLRIPGAAFMNHLGGGTHGLLKPANASSHVVICLHGAGMDFLDTQMTA